MTALSFLVSKETIVVDTHEMKISGALGAQRLDESSAAGKSGQRALRLQTPSSADDCAATPSWFLRHWLQRSELSEAHAPACCKLSGIGPSRGTGQAITLAVAYGSTA